MVHAVVMRASCLEGERALADPERLQSTCRWQLARQRPPSVVRVVVRRYLLNHHKHEESRE